MSRMLGDNQEAQRGKLIVFCAPSGGGKTTIINELVRRLPNATRMVTTTTRQKRVHEQDGIDYFFLTKDQFEAKLASGDFIEHNVYSGYYYGTDRLVLEMSLQTHDFVLAAIDINGKRNFDKQGIVHTSIFLMPDSLQTLERRLVGRGGLTTEQIQERLQVAKDELEHTDLFDRVVVNQDGHIQQTIDEVRHFLLAIDKKPSI